MAEPLDELEIKISSSSTDAVKRVNELTAALERLKKSASGVSEKSSKSDIQKVGKDADKSVKLSKKTVEQIEALSRATQSINSKAGHGMKELAGGLRALASVREVKIPKSLADNIVNLGAAIDLIDDGISEKAIKFSSALGTLAGAGKINISTKLPDRMLDIGAAMDLISDDAIRRLDSMTASLQRLSGVDLKGLPAALREVAKSKGPTGLDMAKVDASIEKTKATIDDLKSKYESLQAVQGKGNQETQARNAAELAKVSALLEEQQRLYDSLIEKKKKYADAGVGRDENLSGTGEVQTRAVEEVTQRVGLLQRVLSAARQGWSMFDAEALKATSEGAAALDNMKSHLFTNMTIWGKIKVAARSALESIKDGIAAAATNVKALGVALRGAIPIIGSILVIGQKLLGFAGTLLGAFKKLASTIAGGLVNGIKKIGSGLKSIGSHVLNYVTKPFQRAIGFIENFKKKLVSVAFYRLVRTALKMITDGFKEGIENLYYFSSLVGTQFAPAMDRLATSSLYLKNSLGAMAGPLIQSVAPMVDFLVDKFVQLLNAINMVFAALGGGGTYTEAIKNAAKYGDDLDSSMGGAAAAAKEFKRYLIGIDELNVIPEQSSPGGGGGGGGGLEKDYASMFEQAPLPDWVKSIKDAIADGDWKGAGKLLAKKVNDSLIAPLKKNAAKWGKNIGHAIQNGIDASLSFIRTLDIEGIGSSVSTLIGNALSKIKPRDLGAILASGIKSAFRFAHGFLQGYTGPEIGTYLSGVVNGWFAELRRDGGWQKAGEDLSNAIKGIIDGVSNFLKGLDTTSIGQDLKDFFGNIDWPGIWMSLKNLAQTAADTIPWKDMLNGLYRFAANALVFMRSEVLGIPDNQASQTWGELQAKLSDASQTINWADIISGLIAFVGDIVKTIKDALPEGGWEGFWEEVKDSIAEAIGFDGWTDLTEQFRTKLYTALKNAIPGTFSDLFTWLATEHPNWAYALSFMFPESTVIQSATNIFRDNLGNGVSEALRQAWLAAQRGGLSDKEILGLVEQWTGVMYGSYDEMMHAAKEGLVQPITDSLNGLPETVEGSFGAMSEGSLNVLHDMSSRLDPEAEYIRKTISEKTASAAEDAIAALEETNSSSSTNMNAIKATVSNAFANIKSTTSSTTSSVKSSVSEGFNSAKNSISSAMQNAKSTTASTWSAISSNTATSNSSISSAVTSAWSNVSSSVSGSLWGVQSSVSSTFSSIVSSAWSWGSDLAANIANGISYGIQWVKNAASSLAGKIRSYLHFSRPDVGPLRALPEWMPDMMKTMAAGIRSNEGIVTSAVAGLSEKMASSIGSMSQQAISMSTGFSGELSYAVAGPDAGSYGSYSAQDDAENTDVINAVNAMGVRIISAINELANRPIVLNGRKVSEETTSQQNRMNRMYGKTLQNV